MTLISCPMCGPTILIQLPDWLEDNIKNGSAQESLFCGNGNHYILIKNTYAGYFSVECVR